jgi:hypothetical protein
MRLRGVRRYGLAAVAACALLALLLPASVAALDSDLKGSAIFRVKASNGYRILVLAGSERADGRTDVAIFVGRRDGGALYLVPATVTPTRFEADLGALGRISLEIVPTGAKRILHPRCGGDPVTVEPDVYRGTFEFRGEEEFTEATASRIQEYSRFFVDFGCGGSFTGESSGPHLPGARLRAVAGRGRHRTSLQVNQNRPGSRTLFEAKVVETHGPIEIERSVAGRAPSSAFDYNPLLRTATVAPPAPFSGRATFRRHAPGPDRWSGNLTVDFPGRSGVPLVRPGSRLTLVHARIERN